MPSSIWPEHPNFFLQADRHAAQPNLAARASATRSRKDPDQPLQRLTLDTLGSTPENCMVDRQCISRGLDLNCQAQWVRCKRVGNHRGLQIRARNGATIRDWISYGSDYLACFACAVRASCVAAHGEPTRPLSLEARSRTGACGSSRTYCTAACLISSPVLWKPPAPLKPCRTVPAPQCLHGVRGWPLTWMA